MIFEYSDYRMFLKSEIDRAKQNSGSLRSFAKKGGVTHSMLSQVLAGKKNLSEESGIQIAESLEMTREETDHFLLLIKKDSTKNEKYRKQINEQIKNVQARPTKWPKTLNEDEFKAISDWRYFALLQLFYLYPKSLTETMIMRKLGFSTLETRECLERLERLTLVNKTMNGNEAGYTRTAKPLQYLGVNKTFSTTAFYLSVLKKSIRAIETQDNKTRISGSETITLSAKSVEKARALTNDYLDRISELAEKTSRKDRVYNFSVHGVRLDQPV